MANLVSKIHPQSFNDPLHFHGRDAEYMPLRENVDGDRDRKEHEHPQISLSCDSVRRGVDDDKQQGVTEAGNTRYTDNSGERNLRMTGEELPKLH